jgi:hypothetical protein
VVDHGANGDAAGAGPLVVRDGDDRDTRGQVAVERGSWAAQRAVCGCHDRHLDVAGCVVRADHRVVVHYVSTPRDGVGVRRNDVAQFEFGVDVIGTARGVERPRALHRARAVAGRAEQHLMPGVRERAAQPVDNEFRSSVAFGRYSNPR